MGRKGKKNSRIQPKDPEDIKSMEISTYFSRVFPNPNEIRPIQKCIYCSSVLCIKLESTIYKRLAKMVLMDLSDDECPSDDEGLPYINCLRCIRSLEIFDQNQLLWHNKREKQLIKGTCGISSGLCTTVANKIATEEAAMIRERYFQIQVSQASSSNSNNQSKSTGLMYQ